MPGSAVTSWIVANPPGLIDLVGYATPAVAVGLRRLRAAYSGPCLRVRRASDNAEQDIGFVFSSEDFDWASAIAFKGASALSVVTWYDQSGNGKDMSALGDSNEPILDTSLELLDFDGTDDQLRTASTVDLSGTDAISVLLTGKLDVITASAFAFMVYHFTNHALFFSSSGSDFMAYQSNAGTSNNKYGTGDTVARVYSAVFNRALSDVSETKFYWNSTEQPSTLSAGSNASGNFAATSSIRLSENDATNYCNMKGYELIVWPIALNDLSRNFAEANQKTYYGL